MKANEYVTQWLKAHQRPDSTSVPNEDQEHFERILEDVCEAYGKALTDKACEWIMTTPTYAKQPSQLVEEFRKAMEE